MKTEYHGYEVIRKIGEGAMSTVYLAKHPNLPDKKVALKILSPGLAIDGDSVTRFKREAHSASLFQHSNVANILDFGEEGGFYFIVMEYISGKDLRQLMDSVAKGSKSPRGLPVGLVIYLVEEIALGLRCAHEMSIIHRDIKPSNIVLSDEGEVKLVDFGLARAYEDLQAAPLDDITRKGIFIGTVAYASPEQAAGEVNLDAQTDVFSLGVVTYELLTGAKPFKGGDFEDVRQQIIKAPHPALRGTSCEVDFPELQRCVDGMLAKNREVRMKSTEEVMAALEACRSGLEQRGVRYSSRRRHLKRLAEDPAGYCAQLRQETLAAMRKRRQELQESLGGLPRVPRDVVEETHRIELELARTEKLETGSWPPDTLDSDKKRTAPRAPALLIGLKQYAIRLGSVVAMSLKRFPSTVSRNWYYAIGSAVLIALAIIAVQSQRNLSIEEARSPEPVTASPAVQADPVTDRPAEAVDSHPPPSAQQQGVMGTDTKQADSEGGVESQAPRKPVPSSLPVKLVVASRPRDARVYIDGELMYQRTPFTFELLPGEHRIRVVAGVGGSEREDTQSVTLQAGDPERTIVFNLE
ncbi:MAG: serine/threonine protein kinase [Candidatus Krumholzibacteriota bacterium]|nr:serine/threonine protein kinase [Candidatus Krumholzibacteriota bacterium]